MAVVVGDAEVDFHADMDGLQDDVTKGVKKAADHAEDQLEKSGKRSGGHFGSAFAGAISGALTGGTITQIAGFLSDSMQEAADAARIDKVITNALVQAGSDARGLTKGAFDGVAKDIAKSLVVDDDDIAAGLAPLLRIPELTKPAFDALARVAADVSAGTGKSLDTVSAALSRLGTAPDDAIGALRGLGVQVDDETKAAVKGLVAQGDEAGALNLVLDQLKGRYEGAAKAAGDAASPQQKFAVAMGDIREKIGGLVINVLPKLTDLFSGLFALFVKGDFTGGLGRALGVEEDSKLIDTLFDIRDVVLKVVAAVRENWPEIQKTITEVLQAVADVVAGVTDVITTIWDNFGQQITEVIKVVFAYVRSTVENALQIVQGIIEVVTGLIHGDWARVWEGIRDIFGGVFDQVLNIVSTVFGLLEQAFSVGLEVLASIVSSALGGILDFFTALPGEILGAIGDVGSFLFGIGEDIVNGLIKGIKSLGGAVVDALLSLIPGPLRRFASRLGIGSPSKVFAGFGRNIGEGLIQGLADIQADVTRAAESMASSLVATTRRVNQPMPVWTSAMRPSPESYAAEFAKNEATDPNRGRPGFVQAEDGSYVSTSFYDKKPATVATGDTVNVIINGVGLNEVADVVERRVSMRLGLKAAF